jgi:hypothetical protein
MRLDNRHLVALGTVGTFAVLALAGCRSGTPGSASADSAATPARADTTPATPAPTASAIVRSDSVVLRTDKTQYKAGETLTLTFENRSAASYAFNPCTRSLEREESGGWKPLPEEGRMCTMEAWILDPRGTRTGTTELPATIAAGRYRVVVRMTVEGAASTAASAINAVSDPITIS